MIILQSLVVFIIIGIVIAYIALDHNYDFVGSTAIVISLFAGIGLLIALICIPCERMGIRAEIEAYYAMQKTIENARENGDELEKATLVNKLIELNQGLAKYSYYNRTVWDIWIPDEIEELELLK